MDVASLGIRVESNGVIRATGDLDGLDRAAGRAERSASALSAAFRLLTPIVAGLGAAFSIRALVGYADAWSDMQSRVGSAIKDMEAAPAMMSRIVEIANASYSPLSQTVEIFGRNVAVLHDLGRNATEAADFTEALNHALVTTAIKGQDADVVFNALSRSIAIGGLRSMEFETIMSRSPRVLEAVADELGTTTTGLRALAQQGRVTGGVIVSALINSLEQLRQEAGEMPATIGDAIVRIQTNFGALIGVLDQTYNISGRVAEQMLGMADAILGATEPIIAAIGFLSDNLGRLLAYATALGTYFAIGWVASFVTAANVTAALTAITGGLTVSLAFLRTTLIRLGIGALLILVGELIYQFTNLVEKTGGVGQAFTLLGQVAAGVFDGMVTAAKAIPSGLNAVWHDVQADFLEMLASLEGYWNGFVDRLGGITWRNPFDPNGETHTILGFDALRIDADGASGAIEHLRGRARELREEAGALANEGFGAAEQALQRLVNVASGANMDGIGAGASFSELQALVNGGLGGGGGSASAGGSSQLNAYQQATKSILDQIDALKTQALTFGLSETAATRFNTAMDLLRAAEEAGIPITTGLIDEINGLADAYALAEERARQLQQQQQLAIDINNTLAQGFSNMFMGIIDGSKNAGQAIGDLLKSLGQLLINNAFMMLFGGGTGGGIGGMFAGLFSFDGGGFTGYGPRSGGIDGRGGFTAILHPNETVIDHTRPANQNHNSRGGDVNITINGSGLNEQQLGRAIADGIREYDGALVPKVEAKFRQMQNDPRAADGGW